MQLATPCRETGLANLSYSALWARASLARIGVDQAVSGSSRATVRSANRLSAIFSGTDFTESRANAKGPKVCLRAIIGKSRAIQRFR